MATEVQLPAISLHRRKCAVTNGLCWQPDTSPHPRLKLIKNGKLVHPKHSLMSVALLL